MPSTYTRNSGFERMATGEQAGTWGDSTNLNWTLCDDAIDGVEEITVVGNSAQIEIIDKQPSRGRSKVLVFLGSPTGPCTITVGVKGIQPAVDYVEKVYF